MEAAPLNYVYGRANCRWVGEDGTLWAFEPSGFVLYAWDTSAPPPRVAEPVEARPLVTGAHPEVEEPLASTSVPLVSFSGWQAVNLLGDATRITLEDRTAAVATEEPPAEEPPK